MVSNTSPLQALSQIAMPKISAGGRAFVPVKASQVLYSHFKYVSGFAQAQGQSGMSIDKLRILNSIIDQLVSMKTKTYGICSSSTRIGNKRKSNRRAFGLLPQSNQKHNDTNRKHRIRRHPPSCSRPRLDSLSFFTHNCKICNAKQNSPFLFSF